MGCGAGLDVEAGSGPRWNRAWPVRWKMGVIFLNLETVSSVMSRQSNCGETSRSKERNSAIAAYLWNAIRSSIFVPSPDQRPLSHLVSKNQKLKARKKWSGGRSGT
ncbi:unnamed protein product [Musa hybrid cultivar]